MQLLDDDMDELFRNAASQYPLKTDGADWDALSRRLQPPGDEPGGGGGSVQNYKWMWMGILLLLTALFFIIWVPGLETGKLPPVTASGQHMTSNGQVTTNNIKNIKPFISSQSSSNGYTKTINLSLSRNKSTYASVIDATTNKTSVVTDIYENSVNDNVGINEGDNVDDNHAATPVTDSVKQYEKREDSTLKVPADSNITVATEQTRKKIKPQAPVEKGFYAGIVASPDFSTVKFQRLEKVGYNVGIIAGYRISRRVAVETGILWERKNYYSEGSSFSTKKITVPADMKILDVSGYCKMFEIPLNVRYYFKNGVTTSWYANGGLSSYLMKKESYDYKYYMNNYVGNRTWDYKNSTQNWFSTLHLGVGMEHNVGVLGKLRVEPYVKIPVHGLGIGNLPITSVGLNVGLTKTIR